jgi:phosphatidylinositol glycan class F
MWLQYYWVRHSYCKFLFFLFFLSAFTPPLYFLLKSNFQRTFSWSLLMSVLTAIPTFSSIGFNDAAWHQLLSLSRPRSIHELLFVVPSVLCCVGAWVGAYPIPLDWNRPWQLWPISCTYGAVGGYLVGLALASVWSFIIGERKDYL